MCSYTDIYMDNFGVIGNIQVWFDFVFIILAGSECIEYSKILDWDICFVALQFGIGSLHMRNQWFKYVYEG